MSRMALNLFDFYANCLIPLAPHSAVARILELVTSGGETTDDFTRVIARDTEVQHWIRLTVQRLGFDKRITRIDQMITLLGQDRIRDVIIGRHIERTYVAEDKTLLGELKARLAKDAKNKPPKPAAPPPPAHGATEGEHAATPAEVEEAVEPIPTLAEFKRYLQCAKRAEEVAIAIRNSYPGQAFAGGVIFDYIRHFLRSLPLKDRIQDPRLLKTDAFVEDVFIDGLRCGIAANEIIQKISIPHQKIIFMTAMLHNVGKPLLLAYDPPAFEKSFLMSTGSSDPRLKVESAEAESSIFDFDHAQAGALFLGRIPFLAEIERSVDYHHNPHLLKFSNPGLYAMACVMRVSGALVKLYQRTRERDADVERIPDQKLQRSEDFQTLRLSPAEWSEIKGNYVLKLLKVQL
jgi:HD-like signal output (HDOD) protein